MSQCLFNEPWIGRCKKESNIDGFCCDEHAKEKCSVCKEQATVRCEASIGLMCGVPLCHLCGAGNMCLDHASSGPLFVIRALLDGGPIPSVFSSKDSLEKQAEKLKNIKTSITKRGVYPTMKKYEDAIQAAKDAELQELQELREKLAKCREFMEVVISPNCIGNYSYLYQEAKEACGL